MQTPTQPPALGSNAAAPRPVETVRLSRRTILSAAARVHRHRSAGVNTLAFVSLVLLLAVAFCAPVRSQQKETAVPLSQRMTINLAAGVPQYIADSTSDLQHRPRVTGGTKTTQDLPPITLRPPLCESRR